MPGSETRKENEFPESVKRKLRDRVANHCSKPDCGRHTIGPSLDDDSVMNVGEAAHITAASPGGPRYDPTLSPKERSSFSNGIWLCSAHAKIIDSDPESYPEEELRRWKNIAEKNAHRMIDSGAGDSVSGGIPLAIQSLLAAAGLPYLDKRFRVDTRSDVDKGLQVHFHAKENVSITITSKPGKEESLHQAMSQFIKFGEPAKLPIQDVSISGSKLLEEMGRIPIDGYWLLGNPPRILEMELVVTSPSRPYTPFRIQAPCQVWTGSGGSICIANAIGGILSMRMLISEESGNISVEVSLEFRFKSWDGKSLYSLPGIADLAKIAKYLGEGGSVDVQIMDSGWKTLIGGIEFDDHFLVQVSETLSYVDYSKEILRHLNENAEFFFDRIDEGDDLRDLETIARNFKEPISLPLEGITKPISLKFSDAGDEFRQFTGTDGADFKFVESEPFQEVVLFGKHYKLPCRIVDFKNFKARKPSGPDGINSIEISPNAGSRILVSYDL